MSQRKTIFIAIDKRTGFVMNGAATLPELVDWLKGQVRPDDVNIFRINPEKVQEGNNCVAFLMVPESHYTIEEKFEMSTRKIVYGRDWQR